MTTKNIVPRATGEGSLGTATKKWGNIYADYITLEDGETLQTKIANQNSRITTAEGTVSTLSGDVTSLYGSVDELSDGKLNLSGGTLTGDLFSNKTGEDYFRVIGGSNAKNSRLALGNSTSKDFWLCAGDGTESGSVNLIGKNDGTLTWNNLPINAISVSISGNSAGGTYSKLHAYISCGMCFVSGVYKPSLTGTDLSILTISGYKCVEQTYFPCARYIASNGDAAEGYILNDSSIVKFNIPKSSVDYKFNFAFCVKRA